MNQLDLDFRNAQKSLAITPPPCNNACKLNKDRGSTMQNTDTYNEMAASCARHLVRMFGSAEDAVKALEDHPTDMVAIAVDAHMETMRKLTNAALTHSSAFNEQILGMVQDKQQRR